MLNILLSLAQTSADNDIALVADLAGGAIIGAIAAGLAALFWKSPKKFVRVGWSLWLGSAALLACLYLTRKQWMDTRSALVEVVMIILCIGGVIGFIFGACMVGISEKEKRLRGK